VSNIKVFGMRLRTRRFHLTIALLAAVFSALLLVLCPAATAQQREREFKKFYADIVITPDGKIDVTENITFKFIGGPWHGIYRNIPVEYAGPRGMNYTLFLDVKSVRDENGQALKFESSRERQYRKLKIFIPNPDNSTRTVSIEYVVEDAIRFFEDHDEFYWNITGDEWDVPIESAGAHIVFPSDVTGLRANSYTGAYRSKGNEAVTEIAGAGVDVHTTSPLGIHEGLTIAIACNKGFLRQPTRLETFWRDVRGNWPIVIPFFAFLAMLRLWWTKGRDPRLRPIAAQYEPPDKLTPGEVGTLIDNSVDMRDITASIVDLAVRGYMVIEEQRKDHLLGLTHSTDYIFHLKKSRAEWSTLKSHEQQLLDGIFTTGNAGDIVSLSDLQNRFYANIPGIKNAIFGALVGNGYYARRPDSVRSNYILLGIISGLLLMWGGSAVARHSGMAPLAFIVAGIFTGAIVCAFGWFMPARTQSGARALEGVLGFEDFLNHVEADRFNRMIKTPEMFEKFLPFAMALGVEKNWSKAFQGIFTTPPQWYQGSYGPNFYPMMFVSNLNSMSTQVGSVMTSAPRSSGGSGFSGGGGSSGGGFGGGGGGAF
jgi:uncharacterized membrane protein YgcG